MVVTKYDHTFEDMYARSLVAVRGVFINASYCRPDRTMLTLIGLHEEASIRFFSKKEVPFASLLFSLRAVGCMLQ